MSNIPHNANTAAGAQHNTHNPLTGDGVTNTHNPLTGDKTGPNPPAGTNPITGRTKDGELGRNEQHGIGHGTTGNVGAGHAFGDNTHNTHNTHNPLTGNGVTNTHNPATGDHTGTNLTGTGTGTGTHTHNTHNPLTGDGVTNTRNPLTGDKTGPNPPPGTNPMTGRTKDGELGRHEQHGAGYGATGATGTGLGDNTHNTHNPLTGNGVTNTHNPLTGDATGPHPTAGTTHTGTGHVGTTGTNTHNTHNPLTGNGVNNTHNPLTGDKTGPHPPAATNPVTGRTTDGELGRHEQHGVGHDGVTGAHTAGAHTGAHTVGTHTAGAHTTTGTHTTGTHTADTHAGAHPTATQTSGGGAKALVGKVEATLGNILHNPALHAKGVQKQEEAHTAKVAKAEGAHHGSNVPPHPTAVGTGVPSHGHRTAEENLAAEGGPAGAGAGAGQMLGGGGRAAI